MSPQQIAGVMPLLVVCLAFAVPAHAQSPATTDSTVQSSTFAQKALLAGPDKTALIDLEALQRPPGGVGPYSYKFPLIGAEFEDYEWQSDHVRGVKVWYLVPIRANSGSRGNGPFGFAQAPGAAAASDKGIQTYIVGEAGIGKAIVGAAESFLGGVRFQQVGMTKVAFFGALLAGAIHFSGETDFLMKPEGGVLIPLTGKKFMLVGTVGVPIVFFTGNHETGFELAGGIAIPLGQ